jgi:Sulfotransferase family
MLKRHPEIYMPERKELWFFAPELLARSRSQARPDTLEGYVSLFEMAKPGQRIGEATPSYLMSHTAARRIADLRPDARIIAILREPASFLRSFHLQCVQNRTETENDLRSALDLEEARREGKNIPRYSPRPQELLYSEHVRYVDMLRRYHAVFPPEQILVLIYEDFRRDNEATVRRVLHFLDVDDTDPIEPVEANPTVRVRSTRLHEYLLSLYLGRGAPARTAKRAVKALTPKRLRGRMIRVAQRHVVFGAPGPPDQDLTRELRRRFRGEVVALSEYLDRDLVSLWGYDDVT